MLSQQELSNKRSLIEQLRQSSSLSLKHADQLGQSIASSWQRSNSAAIPKDRDAAPLMNVKQERKTLLEKAIEHCRDELTHIAEQSAMVAAVGDMAVPLSGQLQVGKCAMPQNVFILLLVGNGEKIWWEPMLWHCH
jgi:septal ring factor EnvC (AmiA/AmiB activator)